MYVWSVGIGGAWNQDSKLLGDYNLCDFAYKAHREK